MDFEKAINDVAVKYANRGYTVIVRPKPTDLPAFARDFKVQVVGRMRDIGVLVAVKRNREEFSADPEMGRYARITGSQPGWRFDFVLLEGNGDAKEVRGAQEPTMGQIEQSLAHAGELERTGFLDSALVAMWSAFEAVMRMRLRAAGESAGWGTPPRDLMNDLVSSGAISAEEFAEVEEASRLRNQIVHGFVAPDDRARMIRVLSEMTRRLIGDTHAVESA